MDGRATQTVLATAALSAFALLLAGPAGAYVPEGDGVHAVGAQSQVRQQAQSVDPGTIPYLSHGMGVDESQFSGRARARSDETQALGLNGDSPLTRVAAPEPEGLTGDSAATRYPDTVSTPAVSGSDGVDWTSFGAGAGMAALLAAGCAGVLLTTRRRHTVGMS